MEVTSIENGIVIDHIRAGFGMELLEYLGVDTSRGTVALIMNATSLKHGKKDIIKIENVIDVDTGVLGLLDHTATVNIIVDGKIARKIALEMPGTVVDVIKCKNPRCVTSTEPAIPHVFHLVDPEDGSYRCGYCDEIVNF